MFTASICSLMAAFTACLPAQQSPFAAEVIQYTPHGGPFDDPGSALGSPTVDTTLSGATGPVVPVFAAWQSSELVTLLAGGSLTIGFDHPVEDDPDNPFGLDFIVFGNTFLTVAGGAPWTNGDPSRTIAGATLFAEPCRVSVSPDGENWYTYQDTHADSFAPTLGRVYNPSDPDPSLGPWNQWWGQPADPTVPLDPSLSAGSFSGMSVAEIALLYGISAGGTPFDLAESGFAWVRYLRFDAALGGSPEIDAAADVAPDCNRNGLPDHQDLSRCDGSPWCADCNGNGRLDGCEHVYGDIDANGLVDLNDVLCVLDGFRGVLCTPSLAEVDLAPCGAPDGIIDLRDIIVVLDAWISSPSPCCPQS